MKTRAPFQVLVLPYRHNRAGLRYAVLRRAAATGGYWQFIAGGGEHGETRTQAAKREAFEEAGVPPGARFICLDTVTMMSVENVCGFRWGPDVLVIPEFCFGVEMSDADIQLSREHTEFRWMSYQSAMRRLRWDSNRTALWELNVRLRRKLEGGHDEGARHPRQPERRTGRWSG